MQFNTNRLMSNSRLTKPEWSCTPNWPIPTKIGAVEKCTDCIAPFSVRQYISCLYGRAYNTVLVMRRYFSDTGMRRITSSHLLWAHSLRSRRYSHRRCCWVMIRYEHANIGWTKKRTILKKFATPFPRNEQLKTNNMPFCVILCH